MLKICIYIGINAHVTPVTDTHTHGHVKVEQYSAEAESAIMTLMTIVTIIDKVTYVHKKRQL